MPPDAESFREVMRRLPTGVSVVTMRTDQIIHGMTANTVTAVSLDPVLILVCIFKGARAHERLRAAGEFTVNMLAAGQEDLSRRFALQDIDDVVRWEGIEVQHIDGQGPRLIGCTAYMRARVVSEYEGGDHTIFLAEVIECEAGPASEPLVFYQRSYRTVTP